MSNKTPFEYWRYEQKKIGHSIGAHPAFFEADLLTTFDGGIAYGKEIKLQELSMKVGELEARIKALENV